jgi:hypothetical protein
MGEVTDKAEETGGYLRTHNLGLDKPVKVMRAESEVGCSCGKAGSEADSAEEGEIRQTRGQAVDQITLPLKYASDATKGISGSENVVGGIELAVEESIFAGEEDSRLVIVPFSQTVVEQPNSDITGEVMDGMNRGIGAYAIYKGGSSSGSLVNVEGEQFIDVPLEVEPLEAHPDCPKGKVCEWVIERVKGMCHVWGMSCEGYKGELEKLFRKIEGNRGKAYNPATTPSKSTLKGNRGLRGLQWNMNYDGKMGKENRGKKQKQRARGGVLSLD